MAIFFSHSIEHFFVKLKIENKVLDIDLVSPEDYSLKFRIDQEVWEKFIENHDETDPKNKSNLVAFRDSLIECIQNEVINREKESLSESTISCKFNLFLFKMFSFLTRSLCIIFLI